jgi:hypothetical protein
MPFLDPTVEYDPEVKGYRSALETFSRLLELGDLDTLPTPREKLGPIRSVQVSRALREDGAEVLGQVKEHAIYLLKGDPYQEPELRYNFNLMLLMDVFGLDEKESDLYESEFDKLLW